MSYEQLTSPNGVERLASVVGALVPFSKDHSMMLWYRNNGRVLTGDLPTVFYIGDNPSLHNDIVWIRFGTEAQALINLFVGASSLDIWDGGYPPAKELVNNHICYVREVNAHRLYVNAQLVAEGTLDVSAFPAPTHQYLGTDTIAADWAPHEGAYFREWDKALTLTQIEAERDSSTPVEVDHLFSDVPFQADFDDSGIRGVNVPTGTLSLRGLIIYGSEVSTAKLALVGHAPEIDLFITPPAGSASLAGQLPECVIA